MMVFFLFSYTINDVIRFYDDAEYQKVVVAAREILSDTTLPEEEEVSIRTYLAFSLVAIGDTTSAEKEFLTILEKSPDFTLNPEFVSPKIIRVFEKAKNRFKEMEEIKLQNIPPPCWKCLLVPGTIQAWKGMNKKSRFFKFTSRISGGGLIVSIISTEILHRIYLSQTEQEKINRWYNWYNLSYTFRQGFFISTGIIYTLNTLDCCLSE